MNRLKEIRNNRELSQLDLSMLTGIQQPAISLLETGRLKPFPGWVTRLAAALESTEAELFGEEVSSHEDSS